MALQPIPQFMNDQRVSVRQSEIHVGLQYVLGKRVQNNVNEIKYKD